MPAWWTRKSKSKPKPKPEPASCSSAEAPNTKLRKSDKREKANSFDEAAARQATTNGLVPQLEFRHPLARPSTTLSSPLLSVPHDLAVSGPGLGSGSASASSVSSSCSDDTPDLGIYRYSSDPINTSRVRNLTLESQRQYHVAEDKHQFMGNTVVEQPRCSEISISRKKEFQMFGLETSTHHQTNTENIFNTAHCARGHALSTSSMHPRANIVCPGSLKLRQDDLKSLPHPLPLPPSSPGSSSSSRSIPLQWKKGKLLGRGTFGHVYLGFNSESGQMCAIKEVKVISDDSNSKECLRQLNHEITLLSHLSHPNVVQYFGSELVDDTLSVYLEYVSGGSIQKLLQEYGSFKEPVIRGYARQILSGLAYLHGRNTVHRDIKGANILVDPNGEVKLADFGMAKHISANTSIHSFKGSPYWMAPEVIMNGNGYNLSVDIWSLGCTILEMATSKPPWSQYEGVAAIFKIGNSKDIPDIPDHLSSEAKSFLNLCLQRDPAARPTADQLMDHPFVRDQKLIKATKSNMFRDMLPSISAENHRMATLDLSPKRGISPLRNTDYRLGHSVEFPSSFRNQRDMPSMRMNMSLPVSPCSSPLRQFKQYNRSCLASPPHQAYSAGAINYGPSNYSLYRTSQSNSFDPWPDVPQVEAQFPKRSFSPLRNKDYGMGDSVEFPSSSRIQREMPSMRMNMSLPVSPCSSPLRQFKQYNRSCLPSSPHPAHSAGAINYGPSHCSLYGTSQSNSFDRWPDIPQVKAQFPKRSLSPLRNKDYWMGDSVEFPSSSRIQRDTLSMRMNMSLPVSPCSSPPRQFKQHNRSCLPSPPHPAY